MARRYIHSEPTSRLAIWARRIAGFALLASIPRDHHRAVGPARNPARARDLRRRARHRRRRAPARVRRLRRDLDGGARGHGRRADGDGGLARAAGLSGLSRPQGLPAAVDLRHHHRSRSIRRATRRWRACGRATPIRSPMRASTPPNSSARPIPTSDRWRPMPRPQAAYDAALAVVNKRRWRVVDARAPQAGRREGHIEAVARTPIMGFRDDVVDPRAGGDRRRAHRRALILALRLVRFRRQCRACAQR